MSLSSSTHKNKKERRLTEQAFHSLLSLLAADKQQAALIYEELRQALITFFALRGASAPDELADETFNRVAYRLAEGIDLSANKIHAYVYAVARNVWREVLARPYTMVELPETEASLPTTLISPEELLLHLEQEEQSKQRYACFKRCLAKLPAADQALLIEYYQNADQPKSVNRQALALKFGVSLGSLRNRVSRIRERLAECLEKCRQQDKQ